MTEMCERYERAGRDDPNRPTRQGGERNAMKRKRTRRGLCAGEDLPPGELERIESEVHTEDMLRRYDAALEMKESLCESLRKNCDASARMLRNLATADAKRDAALALFRLRVAQQGERYAALVLERRGPLDKWCVHATISGMTMTEAREFAKVCGIRLEEGK